jgi:hypothetical protein
MKNFFFYLFSILVLCSTSNSQDFTFKRLDPNVYLPASTPDTTVQMRAIVTNNTSNTYNFRFARIENTLTSGWITQMCYDLCYADHIDTIPPPPSPAYNLAPNQVDTNFYIDFGCHGDGFGTAIVRMYVEGNPGNFSQDTFIVEIGTIGIQNISSNADDYELKQNYPNPFNPGTIINFSIPKRDFVNLIIYDVLGNEVAWLIKNEALNKGRYKFEFNADIYNLSSGIYIYKLITSDLSFVKKMMFVK